MGKSLGDYCKMHSFAIRELVCRRLVRSMELAQQLHSPSQFREQVVECSPVLLCALLWPQLPALAVPEQLQDPCGSNNIGPAHRLRLQLLQGTTVVEVHRHPHLTPIPPWIKCCCFLLHVNGRGQLGHGPKVQDDLHRQAHSGMCIHMYVQACTTKPGTYTHA